MSVNVKVNSLASPVVEDMAEDSQAGSLLEYKVVDLESWLLNKAPTSRTSNPVSLPIEGSPPTNPALVWWIRSNDQCLLRSSPTSNVLLWDANP